jgi:hypothetical protein
VTRAAAELRPRAAALAWERVALALGARACCSRWAVRRDRRARAVLARRSDRAVARRPVSARARAAPERRLDPARTRP